MVISRSFIRWIQADAFNKRQKSAYRDIEDYLKLARMAWKYGEKRIIESKYTDIK